jgi:hypothetical protein
VVEHGGVKLAARELDLSVHTIRTYLARLRDKSGRSTLAQVLLWAQLESASVRSKLIEAPQMPDEEVAMQTAESPWKGLSEAQWATISAYLPAEDGTWGIIWKQFYDTLSRSQGGSVLGSG